MTTKNKPSFQWSSIYGATIWCGADTLKLLEAARSPRTPRELSLDTGFTEGRVSRMLELHKHMFYRRGCLYSAAPTLRQRAEVADEASLFSWAQDTDPSHIHRTWRAHMGLMQLVVREDSRGRYIPGVHMPASVRRAVNRAELPVDCVTRRQAQEEAEALALHAALYLKAATELARWPR